MCDVTGSHHYENRDIRVKSATPMRRIVVGVMGPGEGAAHAECEWAYQLGGAIATQGWILLTGGRNVGVMDAASRGAKAQGGLTIGILPDSNPKNVSAAVDIAIYTNLGNARNTINVLSSDVVVACGMGLGTASEVALALKAGKPTLLFQPNPVHAAFFQEISQGKIQTLSSVEDVIRVIRSHCA